ncbi:BglG family transcription antiterminator [Thalassobacillus pellis]|uniref:BglG family transcription antiterminator n=1 Tax=Thalassobacillus pellis TaxID=748008 RepID=UPI001961D990|nr:BglG family transcription antiterminator [Thalassobacillus pellis]MBM7553933.1 transcriptional antiterminator/mannitol/fructose-specific phosphotransferase system IIA component (Ntr-type) [Thalassobacillus pellis]
MVLDKRRARLLSIIRQSADPIPTKDLVAKMKISQRTIYYDLDQINSWLVDQNLEPIESKHGKGLYLPDTSKSKLILHKEEGFEDWHYQLSKQEREVLIKAKILLEEQDASMQSFMDLTSMSRGTVAKVIKAIKNDFRQTGLDLFYQKGSGYRISGSEEAKRKVLSDILAIIFAHPEWHNVRNEVYQMIQPGAGSSYQEMDQRSIVRNLLYEAEQKLGLTLTDEMVEILSLQILMIIKRVQLREYIVVQSEEKQVLQQTEAYQAILIITNKLRDLWKVSFPDDEICFLTMNLLGSKVQHDDFSHYTERELSGLREVVQRMISDFQLYSCVMFDDKKGLEENLISHIKPTYYRLKYGVKIANDLAASIQKNYPDIFHLTKRVMKHLELYAGEIIPDEEVAYITLHFGGWLTKEKKQVETKFRAIIVCENGIGTSNMLRTQLENLIAGLNVTKTLSIRQYQSRDLNADVVFSTNYIKERDIPVIHVPAILTNLEKEQIIRRMNELFHSKQQHKDSSDLLMEVIEKYATIHQKDELKSEIVQLLEKNTPVSKELQKPMLNELLTEQTIQFKDHVSNWEEAVETAAQPLVEQQSIRPQYIEAMIDNVKELGPYIVIAPRIAIPHARPEAGVEKLGMSFLRLKQPVYFSDKEKHRAQLIIVLAAIDNQTHLKALAQLTEMLSMEENVERLISANDPESVIELINKTVEV